MTLNLSEPYEFKVGEAYQTQSGQVYQLVYISPTDLISHHANHYRMIAVSQGADRNAAYPFSLDGKAVDAIHDAYNLMPAKRQVWVAMWTTSNQRVVYTEAFDSAEKAEDHMNNKFYTRIAVAGPFDVEPPQ